MQEEIMKNHEMCLEMLDVVIDICNREKIEYYLAFGSALGAVRHKGFIPWDINIDILMTTDQFQKFDDVMKYEKLKDMTWGIPENSARIFPLLRKKDSWDYMSKPNIDFSVYADAPKYRLIWNIIHLISYFNIKMFKLKNTNVKRIFPYNILKIISSCFSNAHYKRVVERIKCCGSRESEYMLILLPSELENKEYLKKEWKSPLYIEFEGRTVPILAGYDAYLTMRYGEYMTPVVWKDKGKYKHTKQ